MGSFSTKSLIISKEALPEPIIIPDLIVVTKCDMEKLSNQTFSDLSGSSSYLKNKNEWDIKIILTSSHKNIGLSSLEKDITEKEFWYVADKFRSRHIWEQTGAKFAGYSPEAQYKLWKLKYLVEY